MDEEYIWEEGLMPVISRVVLKHEQKCAKCKKTLNVNEVVVKDRSSKIEVQRDKDGKIIKHIRHPERPTIYYHLKDN